MPTEEINGANINYEVLGEGGPWVVLTPGGRGAMEMVRPLGNTIAAAGYRVLLHDRRNCGASDVVIEGEESEQEIWADDLNELLTRLGALPAWAGGGSAGCRLSLLLTLRHSGSTKGLLLWWVTGGHTAADRLGYNYYGQFIDAAQRGGMPAVCETEFFKERIEANPSNKDRLMAMDPTRFCRVMERWRLFFEEGADLPVIGATEAQLRSIKVPMCIVPGNDDIHPRKVGEGLHQIVTQSELYYLRTDAENAALAEREPADIMAETRERLGKIYVPFLQKYEKG
ncbi:MAG TPA: alpha/beta hydrolase [Dehalococcoidia bacterium]